MGETKIQPQVSLEAGGPLLPVPEGVDMDLLKAILVRLMVMESRIRALEEVADGGVDTSFD